MHRTPNIAVELTAKTPAFWPQLTAGVRLLEGGKQRSGSLACSKDTAGREPT